MFEKDLMQCRVLRQHPLGVKASIHDSDCSKTAHSTIQMQIYSYESRCKVSNFSVRLTTKFMTEHSLLNTRFPSRSNMRWIKEMHLSRQMWVPLDLLKYLHYTFDLKFWDVNKTVEIDWPCTLALAPRYSDGHRKWVWVQCSQRTRVLFGKWGFLRQFSDSSLLPVVTPSVCPPVCVSVQYPFVFRGHDPLLALVR